MMLNLKKLFMLLCSLCIAVGCASNPEPIRDDRDLSDKLEDRWDVVEDGLEDTAEHLGDRAKSLGDRLDDIF